MSESFDQSLALSLNDLYIVELTADDLYVLEFSWKCDDSKHTLLVFFSQKNQEKDSWVRIQIHYPKNSDSSIGKLKAYTS